MWSDPGETERVPLEQIEVPLVTAATEVLETMFFAAVEGDADQPREATEALAAARIRFQGAHSGWFRVVLPESAALALAANFMGATDPGEVTGEQAAQVLGEFVNMVCGATLSRLAPKEIFNLATPRVLGTAGGETPQLWIGPNENASAGNPACARRLITDAGWIDLYWRWEQAE